MVMHLHVGGGGGEPVVVRVDLVSGVVQPIGTFADRSPGLSVYAVAHHDDCDLTVAGTRRVRLHTGPEVAFLRAWRGTSATPAWEHALVARGVTGLAVLPGGEAVVGCDDGAALLLRLGAPGRAVVAAESRLHTGGVLGLRSLDAGRIGTLGADGKMRVLEASTLRELISLPVRVEVDRSRYVLSLGWDEQARRLLHGDRAGAVHSLQIDTGAHRSVVVHTGALFALGVHPETGDVLAGGNNDGTLLLLDGETLTRKATLDTREKVLDVVALPGGKWASLHVNNGRGLSAGVVHVLREQAGRLDVEMSWAIPSPRAAAGPLVASMPRHKAPTPQEQGDALRERFFALVGQVERGDAQALEQAADLLPRLGAPGSAENYYLTTFLDRATHHDPEEAGHWALVERLKPLPWPADWRRRRAECFELAGMVDRALQDYAHCGPLPSAIERIQALRSHPARGPAGERRVRIAPGETFATRLRMRARFGDVEREPMRIWSKSLPLGEVSEASLGEVIDESLESLWPGAQASGGDVLQYEEYRGESRRSRLVLVSFPTGEPRWSGAIHLGFFLEEGGGQRRTAVATVLDVSQTLEPGPALINDVEGLLAYLDGPAGRGRRAALEENGKNLVQAARRRGIA